MSCNHCLRSSYCTSTFPLSLSLSLWSQVSYKAERLKDRRERRRERERERERDGERERKIAEGPEGSEGG